MIEIMLTGERKSRTDELIKKYESRYVNPTSNMVEYLEDISISLGMIYDEMRGVKHADS